MGRHSNRVRNNGSPISDRTYDFLKWMTIYCIPGVQVFVHAILMVWRLPYSTEITGTFVAFEVMLGTILGISNTMRKKPTYDGTLYVSDDEPPYYEQVTPTEAQVQQGEVRLRVKHIVAEVPDAPANP